MLMLLYSMIQGINSDVSNNNTMVTIMMGFVIIMLYVVNDVILI
jgi:hypothetical protein